MEGIVILLVLFAISNIFSGKKNKRRTPRNIDLDEIIYGKRSSQQQSSQPPMEKRQENSNAQKYNKARPLQSSDTPVSHKLEKASSSTVKQMDSYRTLDYMMSKPAKQIDGEGKIANRNSEPQDNSIDSYGSKLKDNILVTSEVNTCDEPPKQAQENIYQQVPISGMKLTANELRKAVIYAEVLGAPKARKHQR